MFSLGHPRPTCLPWASSALFLNLYSHGLLLASLGFPSPITSYSSLEFYGPAINPLLSLLALLWACRGPLLLFLHHTLPMGLLFAISLFPGSFEPIRFLKAHLLILWTVIYYSCCSDLMVFVLYLLPTYFRSMLLGWASSLLFGFHKKTLNKGL